MIVVFDFNNVITCNHHWYDAPTGIPTTSLTTPSSSHEKIDVWWKTTLTTAISDAKWQHLCKRETSHHDDNYIDLGTESLKRDDLAITSLDFLYYYCGVCTNSPTVLDSLSNNFRVFAPFHLPPPPNDPQCLSFTPTPKTITRCVSSG
jgi:hypothetical protein